MSAVASRVEPGAYHDSIVLMALQAGLEGLPGVTGAGAVMATPTNLGLLAERGLLPADAPAGPEDLLVTVRANSPEAAQEALARVPELLARRRQSGGGYRPKSLETAVRQAPEAGWVVVSVPGRYAAQVAGQALDLGRHVFLYSDNVPLAAEVTLKDRAAERGLLVLGPDCGTALVGGVGFGFANRLPRGPVGLVAASGTGLQAVACAVAELGSGVSHALGTGGRDLSEQIGGKTALAALDLLSRDPATEVIVLVSKPPDRRVAARLLTAARGCGKPVVVCLLGEPAPARRMGSLAFACDLDDAAALAVASLGRAASEPPPAGVSGGYLRGLFSGGTLAAEAARALSAFLAPLASNVAAPGVERLVDPLVSRGHTIVDLGADELTVGRLHPMMDPSLLLDRLRREAADPETALLLVDVVLGDGAHPDPAGLLAPVVAEVLAERRDHLEVVAVMVGTTDDAQDRAGQVERLEAAGARVFARLSAAASHVLSRFAATRIRAAGEPVPREALMVGGAVSVGVEPLAESLRAQGLPVVSVDWRPPAGGDTRLAGILSKMRRSP